MLLWGKRGEKRGDPHGEKVSIELHYETARLQVRAATTRDPSHRDRANLLAKEGTQD